MSRGVCVWTALALLLAGAVLLLPQQQAYANLRCSHSDPASIIPHQQVIVADDGSTSMRPDASTSKARILTPLTGHRLSPTGMHRACAAWDGRWRSRIKIIHCGFKRIGADFIETRRLPKSRNSRSLAV